jgi:hypothetical protein
MVVIDGNEDCDGVTTVSGEGKAGQTRIFAVITPVYYATHCRQILTSAKVLTTFCLAPKLKSC